LATDLLAAIERRHGMLTMPLVIREHESLREAAGFGQPITEYAPGSEACRDFVLLVDWLEANPVACTRKKLNSATAARGELALEDAAPTNTAATSGERMADLLARIRQQAAAPIAVEISSSIAPNIESPVSGVSGELP
jgi:hypothetical protein